MPLGLVRLIHDQYLPKIDAEEKLRAGNLTHEGVYYYTLLATGDKRKAEEAQSVFILKQQQQKEGF